MPKGIVGFQKGHKSFISPETYKKIGEKLSVINKILCNTPESRRKNSESKKGEKCHLWQGGKTEESKRLRKSVEFRLWREAVFARDNWTCQKCKERGGKLHPHHIKGFSKFPELRFAIDNGITMCAECHKKTDTWGFRAKKYV